MTLDELNETLLNAHQNTGDNQTYQLADLYFLAYELTVKDNETAGYFYLTNAYVYALDAGHEKSDDMEQRLKQAGRL